MIRTETRAGAHDAVAAARLAGRRIALVPTMGYLHEGHLRLIDRATELADFVAVSVFVNPLQFGPGEDLDRYPRDLERDAAMAAARGAHLLFSPAVAEMYPSGPSRVLVAAPALTERLCGAFRPGHFEGVLTVVTKLFHVVAPDVAVFGRKDFQQVVLVRRMVADLDFSVEIDVAPTVRDADGLAMSSRNARLSSAERGQALALHRALRAAQAAFTGGERSGDALRAAMRRVFDEVPEVRLQYAELADPDTLDDVGEARPGDVLAVAAFIGETRLIDNHVLS